MTVRRWSFDSFVQQMRSEGEALAHNRASVEIEVQQDMRPSVRLRVEHNGCLGELTAWEGGTAHVAVVDLRSGDFVLERDAVDLGDESSELTLRLFFNYFRSSQVGT